MTDRTWIDLSQKIASHLKSLTKFDSDRIKNFLNNLDAISPDAYLEAFRIEYGQRITDKISPLIGQLSLAKINIDQISCSEENL